MAEDIRQIKKGNNPPQPIPAPKKQLLQRMSEYGPLYGSLGLIMAVLVLITSLMVQGLRLFSDVRDDLQKVKENTTCLKPISEQMAAVQSVIGGAGFLAERFVTPYLYEQLVQGHVTYDFFREWFEKRAPGHVKTGSSVQLTETGKGFVGTSPVGTFIHNQHDSLIAELSSRVRQDAPEKEVLVAAFDVLWKRIMEAEKLPEEFNAESRLDMAIYLGSIHLRDIYQQKQPGQKIPSSPNQQ